MLPKIQHNLTNWVDGMKITRQHFVNSENALVDGLRDSLAVNITSFNYGLLQPLPEERSAIDCEVVFNQSARAKITVKHCRAVTAGGCRIEIIPGLHPELVSDQEVSVRPSDGQQGSDAYLAVISVDLFNRQAAGAAAADEAPLRNPYSVSAYRLNVIPESDIYIPAVSAYHMPVARFVVRSGELVADTDYIPPCAVIAAHPAIRQVANFIGKSFNTIQVNCSAIISKILDKGQNEKLAQQLRQICEHCVWHISSEMFSFGTIYKQQPPIYIANSVVQLANAITVCLSLISSSDKEQLLQYFSHWTEVSPGKFEDMLAAVVNADYEHDNLAAFFKPLNEFLAMWIDVTEKMKDLKLIGDKKEGFDFGGRTHEAPKEKKGRFSFFD